MAAAAQLPLASIYQAFELLKRDVERSLHTQIGDVARLEEQVHACHCLQAQIEQVH
jgi:hypothetical protein